MKVILQYVLGLSLKKLLFWSTIGKGARFFLEAGLLVLYGYEAKKILEGSKFLHFGGDYNILIEGLRGWV